MEKLEKKIKTRYILFISTIIIIIISVLIIIQNSVDTQKQSSSLINKASKQCVLSERITKLVISFNNPSESISSDSISSLKLLVNEIENSQNHLYALNKQEHDNTTLDSLLKISDVQLRTIVTSCNNIIANPNLKFIEGEVKIIAETESPYFLTMQAVVREYQKSSEKNLQSLTDTIYFLALIAALILIAEFLFVLLPALTQLFKRNKELIETNKELAISKNKINKNISELRKLKTDLETKEKYNKIFIEQAPTAIAMLDKNMNYIAVSQRWIADYKMEGQEIIGRSHYDLFPEIGDDWKENHQKCLNGAIDICDEARFVRSDGLVQWIYWDVRPWYISEGTIGGLLMHTGDITHIKEKDQEKLRIERILESTNKVARIGTWELNIATGKYTLSKITCEILKVSEDFEAYKEKTMHFYKEGVSRDKYNKTINEIIEFGTPFDIEVEMITAEGESVWVRKIAQAEYEDGLCKRVFGIFQDITSVKVAEQELYDAHMQLKGIFNSGPIAIVSTNNDGIINHFNHGAEVMLGYSASEMVGLKEPEIFHIEEELDKFRIDIAEHFGLNPKEFDPYLELALRDENDTREWTYRRKDGSIFPVQLTLTAIKNDVGEKIGFLGVSFDITERKKTENELLRKNQLLNFAEELTLMGNWQVDVVNNREKWSTNLYHIFGLEENREITTDTYFSFVHPEDKEKVTKHQQDIAKNKIFSDLMHRIKLRDGTIKTILNLAEVITDNLGNIIEIIGTCQDVTAQRMAENKFRGLLESAPDAVVIVNDRLEIQLINKQAELLFGYSTEELFQKSADILIPDRLVGISKEFRIDFFSNPRARGMREGIEFFALHKNGKEIPVQISFSPLQTEEGILVSAAIRDITVQKMAENELLRKNQLLSFAEKITMMGNWQWDLHTNSVKWSANLYHIFGLEQNSELNYDTYFSFVHTEDKERVTKHVEKSLKDKKFIDLMHRIKLTDGTVKTIQLLAEIVTDTAGNPIEMIGTCQDVTEQRMAENKFRGLLESAPDAMVIVNEKGKIHLINKQAEKLFGYYADELFGEAVETLIPKRFTRTHAAHRNGFFSNPKTRGMGEGKELYGKNKKGEEFPIQISLSPLQTEEGILVSAAIRDITAQKIAERKIIESKENLEVLANKLTNQNTQLADFAHITSHNLRAPVSNLNSLLHLYNITESGEDRDILFSKFERVIHHLTLTLNTLVESIKMKNAGPSNLEEITFDEILNTTKEILTGQIIKTGAVITSDFSKIQKIRYNKIYLESIFLNLMGNAIKYRSEDRVPEISFESDIQNGKLKLSITDNGIGIDLQKHGHKLFGLNKVFHRHPDAKGVGLFMTKVQIEAMGGNITATSKVNEGTTFTINFN